MREETIKQVTATFPAKLQKIGEQRVSDISFVCASASGKENDGRLSNAVFKLPPEKEFFYQPNTDRSSADSIVQKKLDFTRLSNSKYSLINQNENAYQYPLTQRNAPQTLSSDENPFKESAEKQNKFLE